MGRTDAKLGKFLRDGLTLKSYLNLLQEAEEIFSLEFPRFERSKMHSYDKYAKILKDWYKCNGKGEKYVSYSKAKAVFQAALKKSVYLIPLPAIGKKLRFRFSTNEEAKEKRRLLKEKEKSANLHSLYARSPTASSSGYSSGEDTDEKNSAVKEEQSEIFDIDLEKCLNDADELPGEDFLKDLSQFLFETPVQQQELAMPIQQQEFGMPIQQQELVMPAQQQDLMMPVEPQDLMMHIQQQDSTMLVQQQDSVMPVQQQDLVMPVQQQDLVMPVQQQNSLAPVEVKFFWQLSEKSNFDSIMLLMFRKQFFIENEGSRRKQGDVVVPDEVWEGRDWTWKYVLELEEKLFIFFQK